MPDARTAKTVSEWLNTAVEYFNADIFSSYCLRRFADTWHWMVQNQRLGKGSVCNGNGFLGRLQRRWKLARLG